MTEKRKKTGGKKRPPQGRSPSVTVFARVSPELGSALDAYIEGTRPRTDKTAVVALALEEYLTKVGFWPPPAPATD